MSITFLLIKSKTMEIIFTIIAIIILFICYCGILILGAYITIRDEWEYKYKRILKKEEKLKQKALKNNKQLIK